MTDETFKAPWDPISKNFVSMGYESLNRYAKAFVLSENTPPRVARMLARSRKQFTMAGADYDNLVSCLKSAFQAIEFLLCDTLGEACGKKDTLGRLISKAQDADLLTEYDHGYLKEFVLRFRNLVNHEEARFTPGMSAEMMTGVHRFVVEFSDRHSPE
ncbi:hypothetical protein MNBD_ACTINO02-1989 [hydrothermal vent metagenome]|uniref:DUF4145 domain-containing protein n=1 Tax=hydrothermal vent metagenome TaxID=652676 RepID=A0A3B0S9X1_9ZZZZ